MGFQVKVVTGGGGSPKVVKALNDLTRRQVLVGIPEKNQARRAAAITNPQVIFLFTKGVRDINMRLEMLRSQRKKKITYEAAHALYIQSHGSALMSQPPRPVIEPAIEARGNKEPIVGEMKQAAKAALDGKAGESTRHLRLAGMLGQNAARSWFTDPRNNWAPNASSTIRRKGSDCPGIDTTQMRKAITFVLSQ